MGGVPSPQVTPERAGLGLDGRSFECSQPLAVGGRGAVAARRPSGGQAELPEERFAGVGVSLRGPFPGAATEAMVSAGEAPSPPGRGERPRPGADGRPRRRASQPVTADPLWASLHTLPITCIPPGSPGGPQSTDRTLGLMSPGEPDIPGVCISQLPAAPGRAPFEGARCAPDPGADPHAPSCLVSPAGGEALTLLWVTVCPFPLTCISSKPLGEPLEN